MKTQKLILVMGALLCLLVASQAIAQDTTRKSGELTVPWDEFKTLLNLDDDEIVLSWETFQKLLALSDAKYVPVPTLKAGNVVLTRQEFDNLIGGLKTPVHTIQGRPVDYLITKASYDGKMNASSTVFTGKFKLHVLKENAYVKIPVVPSSIPLEDITVNGKPALVINENGYHTIVLDRDGEYSIEATFSMASSLDRGPNKIDLSILQTPITILTLQLPLKDIDVEIPQAQQVISTVKGNATIVKAAIASGNSMSIRWRKKIAPTEKVPAKLHAELYHLISIEDGAMTVTSDVNLNILYSEIDAVRVWIPDGLHVLSVSGEGVGEWQEQTIEGRNSILIPFTYAKKGAAKIGIYSEIPSGETGLANVFGGISVHDAVREKGFVGIVLNTSAEVTVADIEGLERLPAQKLPAQITNRSAKPLTMGFKYLKHPYNLVLDVKKHDKVSVPVAAINSANVVTLFTEDGKIVHRMVYEVKNSAKQFLHIEMPDGADVWSVLVDNKPEESSVDKDGTLLVPLIRSRSQGNGLETFPVEVIYCMVEDKFAFWGSRESTLPKVDLLISQVFWSVYLPNYYNYHHFSSSLEIEEMVRGLNVFGGKRRQYDENAMRGAVEYDHEVVGIELPEEKLKEVYGDADYESAFRNVPMARSEQIYQMQHEMRFGGRMDQLAQPGISAPISGSTGTGLLPIQIKVPTGGQVYRFARTIIKPDDVLTMEVQYSRNWLAGVVKWMLYIFIALVIWMNRRKFNKPWRMLKDGVKSALKQYHEHEAAVRNISRSIMTPIVLLGLTIVTWPFFIRLSLLLFLALWIVAAYQIVVFVRTKMAETAKVKAVAADDKPA